jgi:hypothetical protein
MEAQGEAKEMEFNLQEHLSVLDPSIVTQLLLVAMQDQRVSSVR